MDIRRGVYMIYNARKGAWLTCEIFGGNGWRGGRGRASCTFSTFSARVRAWNRPEKGPLLSVGQRRRLLEITNLLEKEREGRRRIGLDWLFREIRFYVPSTLPINIVIYIWSRIFHFPVCSLNSMTERGGREGHYQFCSIEISFPHRTKYIIVEFRMSLLIIVRPFEGFLFNEYLFNKLIFKRGETFLYLNFFRNRFYSVQESVSKFSSNYAL